MAVHRWQKRDNPLGSIFSLPVFFDRAVILHWVAIIAVGAMLGGYTIVANYLPLQWLVLGTVAVLGVFAVIIVQNVRRMLLAIVIIDIPLQLDANLMFNEEAGAMGAVGGLIVSITTMALVGLFTMWLFDLLLKKQKLTWDWVPYALPLILYIGFVSLSIFAAPDKNLTFFEIFLLLQIFLLYVLVINTVKTREELLFIFAILMVSVIIESLIMIALRFVGQTIIIAGIMARVDPGPRVAGTVGSPINAAAFLWATMAPALGMLFTPVSRRYKLLASLALGLGIVALVFTLSRGGWLAFGLSMLFLGCAAWWRGWLPPKVILVTLILAVLLGGVLYGLVADRLTSDDNGSAEARGPLMLLAFRIIRDHPILGLGSNNLPVVIGNYATPELGDVWLYTVHNRYLLIWAETGLPSLLCFLWFLIATVRRGWKCWAFNDRFLSPLGFGIAAAWMGGMVHMFVDVFRSRPDIQMLWLSAGLIVVMYRMGGKR